MRRETKVKMFGSLGLLALIAAAPGDPPVADAAMRGEIETLRILLRSGADVNAPQGDGMTALHWAAERGDLEMTEMLLFAGANLEAVTRIGEYTPLHLASRSGMASTVRALLEAGSDPNVPTASGGALSLHLAAGSGNVGAVEALLDHGSDVNVREPVRGHTPLIFAASYNRLDVVKTLIDRGADVSLRSNMDDTAEKSARDRIIRQRRSDVVRRFQEEQGPQEKLTPSQVQTALRVSRLPIKEDEEAPEEEEEEIDPDEFRFGTTGGYGGLTALLHAVREGHIDVAEALLDAGADIEQVGTGENLTPLILTIINGHFDLAMMLLERGADPNFASNSGDSALYAVLNAHWAAKATGRPRQRAYEQQETGYLDLMKYLLDAGVDPNVRLTSSSPYQARAYESVSVTGATPFWRAAYATDVAAMRLLLSYGADHTIATKNSGRSRRFGGGRNRNAQRGRGGPNQQQAGNQAQGGNPAAQTAAAPNTPAAQTGGNPRPRGAGGRGGNQQPAPGGRESLYGNPTPRGDGLDPSGLPPVPQDGPGVYPIQAASGVGYGQGFAGNSHRHVPDGWMPAVRFLVDELGHEVNSRDANGYTALHHAASRGDNEMIMFLMERGADVTVVSRRGQTVADMANKPSSRLPVFPDSIDLLVKLGSKLTPKPRNR